MPKWCVAAPRCTRRTRVACRSACMQRGRRCAVHAACTQVRHECARGRLPAVILLKIVSSCVPGMIANLPWCLVCRHARRAAPSRRGIQQSRCGTGPRGPRASRKRSALTCHAAPRHAEAPRAAQACARRMHECTGPANGLRARPPLRLAEQRSAHACLCPESLAALARTSTTPCARWPPCRPCPWRASSLAAPSRSTTCRYTTRAALLPTTLTLALAAHAHRRQPSQRPRAALPVSARHGKRLGRTRWHAGGRAWPACSPALACVSFRLPLHTCTRHTQLLVCFRRDGEAQDTCVNVSPAGSITGEGRSGTITIAIGDSIAVK